MNFGPRKQLWSFFLAAVVIGLIALELSDMPGITRTIIGIIVAGVSLLAAQIYVDGRRIRKDIARSRNRQVEEAAASRQQNKELSDLKQLHSNLQSNVDSVRVTGENQLKELQYLRSDIEWLEQVLQGVTNSLSGQLNSHSLAGTAANGALLSDHALSDALEKSLKALGPSIAKNSTRVLNASPNTRACNHSSRRINRLLGQRARHARYLEVGVEHGKTFENVHAATRIGVDPVPQFETGNLPLGCKLFVGSSDDFFQIARAKFQFDAVFIDGLHEFQQVYRDLMNALDRLRAGGVVLVDDVVPSDCVSAMPDLSQSLSERRARGMSGSPWHGDVYKLVATVRDLHPELEYRTIIGSGNEQLLIWQTSHGKRSLSVMQDITEYGRLSFDDVFAKGIPSYFRPVSEDEAILAALEGADRFDGISQSPLTG